MFFKYSTTKVGSCSYPCLGKQQMEDELEGKHKNESKFITRVANW